MATIRENLKVGYEVVRKELQNLRPVRNVLLGGLIIFALIVFEMFFVMPLGIKLDKVPMGNVKFTFSGIVIGYIVSCMIYYGYIYTKPQVHYDTVDSLYYGWMYGVLLWGVMGIGSFFYNDLTTNILNGETWVNASIFLIMCVIWGVVAAFVYSKLEKAPTKKPEEKK